MATAVVAPAVVIPAIVPAAVAVDAASTSGDSFLTGSTQEMYFSGMRQLFATYEFENKSHYPFFAETYLGKLPPDVLARAFPELLGVMHEEHWPDEKAAGMMEVLIGQAARMEDSAFLEFAGQVLAFAEHERWDDADQSSPTIKALLGTARSRPAETRVKLFSAGLAFIKAQNWDDQLAKSAMDVMLVASSDFSSALKLSFYTELFETIIRRTWDDELAESFLAQLAFPLQSMEAPFREQLLSGLRALMEKRHWDDELIQTLRTKIVGL